jgi:serine/threonine-protein kinase
MTSGDVVPVSELAKIANYDVLSKLASGGMAEIFVAQRHGSSDICVIKQLHSHLAKDAIVASRFIREANVASLLDHPHIARIVDADLTGENVYLAMEFIAGQDIESMMFKLMEQQKMLPPPLSVTATIRVLEGLAYAHAHRGPDGRPLEIVHRDLSPRNVMITYAGDVKIIDFGLARTNLGEFRTAPGMVLGTLRYMSPEQAVAEPVDRRSDLYTWAVVLYEMLSGRPLVMGANAHEVLHAVVTMVPRPLSQLNPSLPKALDPVLEKGMAKDRRDRFSSAEEFVEALIEAAGDLGEATEEQIGAFVCELFPEEHLRTEALFENVEKGEPVSVEPTRYEPAQDPAHAETVIAALPKGPITPAALPTVEEASQIRASPLLMRTATAMSPYIQSSSAYETRLVQSEERQDRTRLVQQSIIERPPAIRLRTFIALAVIVPIALAFVVAVMIVMNRTDPVAELIPEHPLGHSPSAQAPAVAPQAQAQPAEEIEHLPKKAPVTTPQKARTQKKEIEHAPPPPAPEKRAAPASKTDAILALLTEAQVKVEAGATFEPPEVEKARDAMRTLGSRCEACVRASEAQSTEGEIVAQLKRCIQKMCGSPP